MKKKFETKLFQTSFLLLSIVHINAPLAAARHNPSKLGFCSRLAQTFVYVILLGKYSNSQTKFKKRGHFFYIITPSGIPALYCGRLYNHACISARHCLSPKESWRATRREPRALRKPTAQVRYVLWWWQGAWKVLRSEINVFDIKAKKKFETISFQTSFSCFVTPIGFKPITF